MPALENPKHEAFCLQVAQGARPSIAYKGQFPEATDGSANTLSSRWLKRDSIRDRINEIRRAAAAAAAALNPPVEVVEKRVERVVEEPLEDDDVVEMRVFRRSIEQKDQQARVDRRVDAYLTIDEKRRMMAGVARTDLVSLMNEDGSMDLKKLQEVPAWAIQEFIITENSGFDSSGEEYTKRVIKIKLVDRLRAIELDNTMSGEIDPVDLARKSPQRIAAGARARALLSRLTDSAIAPVDG